MCVASIATTHIWAYREVREQRGAFTSRLIPISCAVHALIEQMDGANTIHEKRQRGFCPDFTCCWVFNNEAAAKQGLYEARQRKKPKGKPILSTTVRLLSLWPRAGVRAPCGARRGCDKALRTKENEIPQQMDLETCAAEVVSPSVVNGMEDLRPGRCGASALMKRCRRR